MNLKQAKRLRGRARGVFARNNVIASLRVSSHPHVIGTEYEARTRIVQSTSKRTLCLLSDGTLSRTLGQKRLQIRVSPNCPRGVYLLFKRTAREAARARA